MTLSAYFDDCGTHKGSALVVWCGFMGFTHQWHELEYQWDEELGKRGLAQFHMSECEAMDGDYGNRAERDSLIHDLRAVILGNKVVGCGVGVVADAFAAAPPWIRANFGSAEEIAVYMSVRDAIEMADLAGYKANEEPISFFYDQGAKTAKVFEDAVDLYRVHEARIDAVSKLPVSASPALQAADMLGWELRKHFLNRMKDRSATPRPHFQRFVDAGLFQFSLFTQETVDAQWRKGPPPSMRKA